MAYNELTEREMQYMHYLLKGVSRKDIANKMGITYSTAGSYMENVKLKLGLNRKRELVEYAKHNGMYFIREL